MINNLRQYKKIKRGLPAQAGFTLIETLIAIVVLMLSITGPLTLAEKGLHATLVAKDQDTAFYLAQDGMEYVRWVRDTNKLRGNPWLAGLDGTTNGHTNTGGVGGNCTAASGCIVDSLKDTTASCSGNCSVLNYDSTNNYFTYTPVGSGVTPSIFTRSVYITTNVSGNVSEASVTIVISWYDQGSLKRSISVKENIFDWQ